MDEDARWLLPIASLRLLIGWPSTQLAAAERGELCLEKLCIRSMALRLVTVTPKFLFPRRYSRSVTHEAILTNQNTQIADCEPLLTNPLLIIRYSQIAAHQSLFTNRRSVSVTPQTSLPSRVTNTKQEQYSGGERRFTIVVLDGA